MKINLRKCVSCKEYTLKEKCQNCGGKTIYSKSLKYSPEDKYGKYRRIYKEMLNEN